MTTPAPTITDDHTEFALALARMAAESPDADSWMAAYVAVRAAGGDHEDAIGIADGVVRADSPKGVGVFVELPPEIAAAYPSKPEDDSPAHITVQYLGEQSPEAQQRIVAVVQQVVAGVAPFDIVGSGAGKFENDDADVLYTPVRAPELEALHERLDEAMAEAGIEWPDPYPQYVPHVTFRYLEPGVGWRGKMPEPWAARVGSVHVWGPDVNVRFAFGAEADDEYATDDDIDADDYEEIADDEWDDATEFAKRAEIGERRTRKDGSVWEKKTEKSWVKVQSKDGSDYTRQRSRAAKVGTEVTRKDGSVWTKVGKSKWKRTKTAEQAAAESKPQEPVAADQEPTVPEQEPEAPQVDDAPVADEAADPEADKPVRPLTGKEMAGMKLAELRAHAEKIGATPPRDARSKKAWANSIDMRQRLLAQQAEGGPQQEKKREPSKPKRDSGSPSGDSASITPPGRVAMTIPAKDMEAAIPRDGWGDIASIRGKLREMGHNLGPGQLQDFLTEAQRQGVLQLGRWPEALREIPHPNHAMMTPDGSVVYYAKLTGNLGDVKIGATPSAEDVDSVLTDRLQPIPVVYEKLKQKGVDIGIGAFKDRIYSMNRNSHTDPKHSVNIGAWSEALRNLPDPETAMLGMNSIVIHFVGRGPRNSQ